MYQNEGKGFKAAEMAELKQKIRIETNPRMKLRYDVILLYLRGYQQKNIASIFSLAPCTVGIYIHNYMANGIGGLAMQKNQGVKSKMTLEQEKSLYDCITTKLPAEVGFAPHMNWTAPLACLWLKETSGIAYSERGMRNVFKRLKLSYTRPTYTLKKADFEKQAAFKEDFEALKKTDF